MVCHFCGSEAPDRDGNQPDCVEADVRLARIAALMEGLTHAPATSAAHRALVEELRVEALAYLAVVDVRRHTERPH
jgi:hypothetical protein